MAGGTFITPTPAVGLNNAKVAGSATLSADTDPTAIVCSTKIWADPQGLGDGVGFTIPVGFAGKYRIIAGVKLSAGFAGEISIQLAFTGTADPDTPTSSMVPSTGFSHAKVGLTVAGAADFVEGGTVRLLWATDAASVGGVTLTAAMEIEQIEQATA